MESEMRPEKRMRAGTGDFGRTGKGFPVFKKYSLFCRLVSLFCLLGNFAANRLTAPGSRVR
jgi:hypothetical protein